MNIQQAIQIIRSHNHYICRGYTEYHYYIYHHNYDFSFDLHPDADGSIIEEDLIDIAIKLSGNINIYN